MLTASVIIPTYGRPTKLTACLERLGEQRLCAGDAIEVIVAEDAAIAEGDEPSAATDGPVTRLRLPRVGVAAARNAAIERARGAILLFINDDCYPDANWAATHIAAQRRADAPAMIVGRTDWMAWPSPTIFDGLVRDTSMIFFYHGMRHGSTYGFRHFWTCNASVPTAVARNVGGFDDRLRPYLFDDVEFAWRVDAEVGGGVQYDERAVCVHDHRVGWDDYLDRERCLGRMAACLSEVNPACFREIFGYDDARRMRDDFEAWLGIDADEHRRTESRLRELVASPLDERGAWPDSCEMLYSMHLPVKRRHFRQGFVDGFELRWADQWRRRFEATHVFS
ncbi:MAG TPA: glycosyltransferase [Phycisphaerae bacterium]|nr:glycosyltransferase [Phycisphaerae bacterium]HRW52290.1 glycosyltransferase [Phycisphaerae bacterium]